MSFTIQSNDVAQDPSIQSVWYDTDIAILVAGHEGRGVVAGCAVSAQGTPDMTVAVAAGTIRNADGSTATVSSGNLTVGTADGTHPRIDLISASAAGVKTITAGTPAASPKPPDLPSGHIGLAMILVGTSDTAIQSAEITDKRVILPSGSKLIGVQRITATGAYTYTPTAGTTSIIVELQGAGGGGAAVGAGSSGQVRVGAGGGGGGWLRKRLTADFSGATGSVGAKGTGGASGGDNAGSAGGNTTFVDTAGSPTTYTASGGSGGSTKNGAPVQLTFATAGGAASGGDDNRPGGAALPGVGYAGPFYAQGGAGGTSMYSAGGAGAHIEANPGAGVAGGAAGGKGGGGGGAAQTGTGASAAGGDGSDGMVIIWEYA